MPRRIAFVLTVSFAVIFSRCVSVERPDTSVKVGLTSVKLPESKSKNTETAPYAKPLKKVSAQQSNVARKLAERDWEDLVEESSDWITCTRELSGYAGTSHDPGLFLACCDELVQQIQLLRQAAIQRDAAAAQEALGACDAPLNRLTMSFPVIEVRSDQAATASPPPISPSTPSPTSASERKARVP